MRTEPLHKRLFCFGFGYTAKALAARLASEGWRIIGTVRSPEKADTIRSGDVAPVVWSGDALDEAALENVTAILVSTPPSGAGCPALLSAQDAIAARCDNVKWIGYLSTNGVYGDHGGAWVDEDSALKATSARARRRIAAEAAWGIFCRRHGLPLAVFRLPGIYGPGRSALDAVRNGVAKRINKPGQVFNRMHVDDIAASLASSLAASLHAPEQQGVYNFADDEPAPQQDVVAYACQLLGVEPPPLTAIEDVGLSQAAMSFYADNKRVSNRRMKSALAIELKYPTYREGLSAILKEEATCP
jgi:nucleoside-diphosphate-sugar epimerase